MAGPSNVSRISVSPDPAAIVAAAPVLIWSAGLDRDHDWFSASWSAYTGLSNDELSGRGWTRVVHPEDVDRCIGIQTASFEAHAPFSLDLRLRRHDGDYRWMLDNGVPRFAADGRCVGFVGSLVDIHERKSLEETLAERARSLRVAERRQGQFLAMLSHELRNPLAPIANAASVLRTIEHTHPLLVRLREILERQVGRLGHLIEDLIDVTRAAQGQISLVRLPVSVAGVVQSAVAATHDRIVAGGHRLDVDAPDASLFVRGDGARLAQALGHLVANAARFTTEPGAIGIVVRRVAKTVRIAVRDPGRGIEADFLPQAFDLFAQHDQGTGQPTSGLGVGLTLARRVAQLHGGDVEGFSEGLGQGSEFVLWLPLIDAAAGPGRTGTDAPKLGQNLRVLIVEDEHDALGSLRLQMELWGTEVSTAANAVEALGVAARTRPQIVLCDIGLPGIDGPELVEQMRVVMAGSPVLFAAVTAYASAEDPQSALAAGFDSFFVKPLDADTLARLLHACVDRQA